ncbi:hypothetical protein GCM10010912_54510 [Paenibacillus albidus]|uniref:Uncharacterized protein n=1 Tax=Paenibacillus albidus TaxID=2041023 RepID=A0A917CXV8_9BACL|nr:hypothetical protein [Paenibacillus albidus]GGG02850.1 hypothetical protein GCM10010912_54510 [Paenibacillus albidus]
MSIVRLSIPVGMLVENMLTSGESKEVIIDRLQRGDFEGLTGKVKEPEMPFGERLATATEMGEPWEEAIRSGYEYKFLHIGGLKRLLTFRFGRVLDQDYVQDDLTLRQLWLRPEEITALRALIGRQWLVHEEEGTRPSDSDTLQNSPLIQVSVELKYK